MPTPTNPEQRTATDVPRSVGRAFELLEIVVEAGDLNLTTAASRAGLTPTTALRHLRALEALGYVRRGADGDYAAGPAVVRLAARARDEGPVARLVAAAQPVLDELTATTGESSYLAVVDGDQALYVATAESNQTIRHVGWVGRTVPLAGTAVGAALRGGDGPQHRRGSIEPDIAAVAQPVTGGDRVVAAISVIAPAYRMDDRAVASTEAALARAVDRLRAELDLTPTRSAASE